MISQIFKNLLIEQITLFYKSSSFKVVIYLSKGSQCTWICFGIVNKVKKKQLKMESNSEKFGKSFSRFCLCTSRFSNCRAECIRVHSKDCTLCIVNDNVDDFFKSVESFANIHLNGLQIIK